MVKQAGKIPPGLIKSANSEINNTVQQRINQIILQGGEAMKRLLPNILRAAMKHIYQMPFWSARNIKQQLQKFKNKGSVLYTFLLIRMPLYFHGINKQSFYFYLNISPKYVFIKNGHDLNFEE